MVMLFVTFVCQMILLCCRNVARLVPVNYILLSLFTVAETFVFCVIASQFTAQSALMAGGMTAGMTAGLTVYALKTETDFTMMGSFFFILSLGMIMLSLCSIIFTFASFWTPVISAIFVVCYGLYLVFDI